MQVNISKKTVIILVAAFLATGLVTTLVGVFQEDKESEEQVDKKGTSDGHFRQRDQDREEGASDEEKKPFSVEKPLENDPYEELQSLIGLESVKEEVRKLALDILEDCADNNIHEWGIIKNRIKDEISKLIAQRTRRAPMILPILQEV